MVANRGRRSAHLTLKARALLRFADQGVNRLHESICRRWSLDHFHGPIGLLGSHRNPTWRGRLHIEVPPSGPEFRLALDPVEISLFAIIAQDVVDGQAELSKSGEPASNERDVVPAFSREHVRECCCQFAGCLWGAHVMQGTGV